MTPRWIRILALTIPRRYRDDVVDDLIDEHAHQIARGRSRARAATWIAGELLRSAGASRRRTADHASPGDAMLSTLAHDVRYALRYFSAAAPVSQASPSRR